MKNILSLFLGIILLWLCSCTRYITPPSTGPTNIGYIPRPMFNDSVSSKIYAAAGYSTNTSKDGHLNFYMGNLEINRGHTYRNINFGYGLFANLGKAIYRDTTKIDKSSNEYLLPQFKKSFNNIGLRTTIGYQIVSDNERINFRIINWENAISFENGSYSKYRNELYNSSINSSSYNVYVNNLTKLYSTGFSTEIIKNDAFGIKDLKSSIRLYAGGTFNLGKRFKNITNSNSDRKIYGGNTNLSYFLSYKQFYGSIQLGADINLGAKFLLGYTF